ncbi:MAG: sulfite exporter TauE/SafE family protein [Tepidisphaerales bacterium]
MVIWAWLGAAAVGLSLGLLGSGGAILTVPILVYLVGHDEKSAIAESLAIVGAIALVGMVRAALQGRVDARSALLLAVPGIAGAVVGAHLARYIPGAVQLLLLAGLMLAAAGLMFRGRRPVPLTDETAGPGDTAPVTAGQRDAPGGGRLWVGGLQGLGLGMTTGLVGVGGGFLIVPVLVLLRRLPMSVAVGTSLAIITANSIAGFFKYLLVFGGVTPPVVSVGSSLGVHWPTIGMFSAVGVAGSLVGNRLATRMPDLLLKRLFAVFLVVMAGYIVVRQTPRVFPGWFGPPAVQAVTERQQPVSGTEAGMGTGPAVGGEVESSGNEGNRRAGGMH